MADYVFMNNGDFQDLYRQVEHVLGSAEDDNE